MQHGTLRDGRKGLQERNELGLGTRVHHNPIDGPALLHQRLHRALKKRRRWGTSCLRGGRTHAKAKVLGRMEIDLHIVRADIKRLDFDPLYRCPASVLQH